MEKDNDSEEQPPAITRRWQEIGHLDFVLPTKKINEKMVAKFSLICYKKMVES